MSKKAKMALILIFCIIVILLVYLIYSENKTKTITTSSTNSNSSTNIEINNQVANNAVTQNPLNTVDETTNTISNNSTSSTNTVDENNMSDEEKAIKLAKEKWGSTDGVYFSLDSINSDETYVISIRDSATTKVLDWYTVNIETGSVTN